MHAQMTVVNVEFYTGVDERLDVPIMLPPTPAAVDLCLPPITRAQTSGEIA